MKNLGYLFKTYRHLLRPIQSQWSKSKIHMASRISALKYVGATAYKYHRYSHSLYFQLPSDL